MSRPVTIDQIRRAYLDFFESKGHLVVPSSSLIPTGDPTLLLTSAGMVQFKDYFSGEKTPPNPRLASVQKCFRTSDIDGVGDTKHLTFFEMLGNFSIGDYFKKEAIAWGWEFSTEVLELPKERLWISVYLDDDEAFGYWRDLGVSEERILRYGDEENFWGPAGEEGPCGPSSEIHYDYGEEYGPDDTPATADSSRFVEMWNLVFTQFYHHRDGSRTRLPTPNIDTGMGLERCAAIMQNVLSVYESDVFDYLVARATELAGKRYGDDEETDFALRVLAEHARSVTFLIADGVAPSNEGRGYVLRRVLRRAVRYARKAGIEGPFLTKLTGAVIERMSGQYPELSREREFITSVVTGEEERFSQTLDAGIELLEKTIARTRAGSGDHTIAGADIFLLYDTYGFPPDITHDIAREHGLEVDLDGFEREMEAQRQRGRASAQFGLGDKASAETYRQLGLGADGAGRFTGYESLAEETVVIGLLREGEPAQSAAKGDPVELILRETPFYAEAGGQVGDSGEVHGPSGRVRVTNTQSPVEGLIAHTGEVIDGIITVGNPVRAAVDEARRANIVRNHTGTHLLHAALRRILGPHVRQAGSLVAPDRLRFDFSHPSGLSTKETEEIQSLVNSRILENLPVAHETMSYTEAIDNGALAFFGDKYGDVVRTCRIGPSASSGQANGETFSFELCGGIHAEATGEIGLLHIESEGSIAAGTRRIEAVTGHGSEGLLIQRHALLESLAKQLQTSPAELSSRVGSLLQELDAERKRAAGLEREMARGQAESLQSKTQIVDGVTLLTSEVEAVSADALRETGAWLRDRLESGIVVLGAVIEDRPSFVAMVTSDLTSKGYSAGNIVREVAKAAGGGGGGRPEAAQGAGKDASKLAEALELVPTLVKQH